MDQKRTTRFIFALTPVEREALATLAQQDGITQSGAIRQLLRREARERGLLVELSEPNTVTQVEREAAPSVSQ